ncbi:MAG: amino acid permease, partial [Gemmataceae bacterium]
YVGRWLSAVMSVLFVTSVFAGLLAFHNTAARYFYALGREGLLPGGLGRTHLRHSSPHIGSLVQTAIGVAVVALFAAAGADPVLTLFSWLTNVATLGVIALMALSSAAVPAFFSHHGGPSGGVLRTRIAPVIAAVTLAGALALAILHFDVLTGSTGLLRILLPAVIPAAAGLGALRAWHLRRADPDRYRSLGRGLSYASPK